MTIQQNRQRLFEEMVTGLYNQNSKSENTREGCMYRLEGKKCAIGHLIPDVMYMSSMDERSEETPYGGSAPFSEMFARHKELLPIFKGDSEDENFIQFLSEAQWRLHDCLDAPNFREEMLEQAYQFADRHYLSTDFIHVLLVNTHKEETITATLT
jgi:hypothetical protein